MKKYMKIYTEIYTSYNAMADSLNQFDSLFNNIEKYFNFCKFSRNL